MKVTFVKPTLNTTNPACFQVVVTLVAVKKQQILTNTAWFDLDFLTKADQGIVIIRTDLIYRGNQFPVDIDNCMLASRPIGPNGFDTSYTREISMQELRANPRKYFAEIGNEIPLAYSKEEMKQAFRNLRVVTAFEG